MSGILKPSVAGLGPEIIPTIIGESASHTWGSASALFDQSNTTNTTHDAYAWVSAINYIELLFLKKCNIWRCPASDNNRYAKLSILKYNGSTYDNVTSLYPQIVTHITNAQWEKTISDLLPGQYKFTYNNGERSDGEWYVEASDPYRYLIKDGDNICNTDGNALQIQSTLPFTIDLFDNYGIADLSLLNATVIDKIINNKYNIALLV